MFKNKQYRHVYKQTNPLIATLTDSALPKPNIKYRRITHCHLPQSEPVFL